MMDEKNIVVCPKDIRKEIEHFLQDRFQLSEDFTEGDRDYTFFGLRGLIDPRELTYLTHLLEMRYDIQFGMKEYDDPMFYSLNGLSEIVADMINERPHQEVTL